MADTVALSPERRFELSEQANRKVFKRLVPFLLLMYVIAFLDRSNVSFAQEEFEADFGISTASYAFGAGLFFVGYAIFEVPSNLLLHKVGAKWWLSRIMVTWGIVAAAFVFVQGPISFYILRFLLGVMEAGFFPGVILFLTYWVPARHLSRARGYFYMGIALAGILGNPLSGGLLELNGVFGLRGIQWMFLVEGLLAVAVGIWAFFYLTDRPEQATWLPDDQREALVETIDAEDTAKEEGHGPKKVLAALGNWRVWYFALIYFCLQIAVYGVTFFLPTQVTAITGQKLGFQSSLVTAIPWVFALVGLLIFPGLADRTRKHRLIGSLLLLGTAFGIVISGALSSNPVLAIGWSLPGRDGVHRHVPNLLDAADGVHDRIRRRRRHRIDQLAGQPRRVPGAHPARLLQGNARRERGPVLPGHRCRPGRSAVCCDRVLQEGQRGRGWPPGRCRRHIRTARQG